MTSLSKIFAKKITQDYFHKLCDDYIDIVNCSHMVDYEVTAKIDRFIIFNFRFKVLISCRNKKI